MSSEHSALDRRELLVGAWRRGADILGRMAGQGRGRRSGGAEAVLGAMGALDASVRRCPRCGAPLDEPGPCGSCARIAHRGFGRSVPPTP